MNHLPHDYSPAVLTSLHLSSLADRRVPQANLDSLNKLLSGIIN